MEYKKKRYFSAPYKVAWDLAGKATNEVAPVLELDKEGKASFRRRVYKDAIRDKDFFKKLVRDYFVYR